MESEVTRYITRELDASLANLTALHADEAYRETGARVAELFIETLKGGNTLLFAGNGGSAADSQHIAGEFVSRFHYDRPGLPAIALTTDSSILTAIGNDYGYERVFSRQIEAIGRKGDVFIAISTSGNSPNILAGIEAARKKGITVVGMTGRTGGKMKAMCDLCLCVPSDSTPRIQEGHLVSYHFLCGVVEASLFPRPA
ncbi:MAG: D-sedoheptulose 7-phosphate isomerase [Hyphomicrobium sp.]